MNRFRKQKQNAAMGRFRSNRGFSVFELVAFIILASIVYAGAVNRFAQFPGQAERANFLAISTQLKSAINVEMMFGTGVGRIQSPQRLAGANPMDFMLEPPSNYIGAYDQLDISGMGRRVWYFDRSSGELVYLVNDTTGVFLILNGQAIPTNEIRFRIQAVYSAHESGSGLPVRALASAGAAVGAQQQGFDGVRLTPSIPYVWNQLDPGAMVEEATSQNEPSVAQN